MNSPIGFLNRPGLRFFVAWGSAVILLLAGCVGRPVAPVKTESQACTPAWIQSVDAQLVSGDGAGHGPDPGSDEWQSVIEFKLGIRGQPDIPPRGTEDWCHYIDTQLKSRSATPSGPSYSCEGNLEAGSVAAQVCEDAVLAGLDRQLADVYQQARAKSGNQHPPTLAAEQRGWIKGRDECWKASDRYRCISTAYQRRTAELQARYGLVGATGPLFFVCDKQPAKEVVVTFYRTGIPTLVAEFGDSVSVMYQEAATEGIRYQGRNESFSKRPGGETTIVWGYGQPPMNCQPR